MIHGSPTTSSDRAIGHVLVDQSERSGATCPSYTLASRQCNDQEATLNIDAVKAVAG
jgi:hypothetical protein